MLQNNDNKVLALRLLSRKDVEIPESFLCGDKKVTTGFWWWKKTKTVSFMIPLKTLTVIKDKLSIKYCFAPVHVKTPATFYSLLIQFKDGDLIGEMSTIKTVKDDIIHLDYNLTV